MEGLTRRQHQLLKYIVQYTCRNLYQPTYKEICAEMGIGSTNAIKCHLDCLRRKGYIRFNSLDTRSFSRALHLTEKALSVLDRTDPLLLVAPVEKGNPCPSS